ncbi:MAG: TrmH family RNA methyltransferase [Pirellulaceae bacterium]
MITSLQNARVKETLRLRKSSAARRESERFIIDGPREISMAIENGLQIETLFFQSDALNDAVDAEAESMPQTVRSLAPEIQCSVAEPVMQKLSYGQKSDDLVAVARTPTLNLEALSLPPNALVLALDQTEKPGNIGACMRTASACAVDAVVLVDPLCEVFNPNTIRASRGTVFTVPIAVCAFDDFCEFTRSHQLVVHCGRLDGALGVWDLQLGPGTAVVVGNEASGLGNRWQQLDSSGFRIPMTRSTDSLNMSVSAAVTLYEAMRQRSDSLPNRPKSE